MEKLTHSEVIRILENFQPTRLQNEHEVRELTYSDFEFIYEKYRFSSNEEMYRNANKDTHESLVTYYANMLANDADMRIVQREQSDNRHMDYFDRFLAQGEADIIQEVLMKYEIPTSILRGIKIGKDYEVKNPIGTKVVQKVSEDSSLMVDTFEIYYKGKLIYKFDRETNSSFTPEDIEEVKVTVNPEIKKKSEKGEIKSKYLETYIQIDEVVNVFKESSGKIVYKNSKGRYTKKL